MTPFGLTDVFLVLGLRRCALSNRLSFKVPVSVRVPELVVCACLGERVTFTFPQ